MLGFYLSIVVIWMIVIYALINIFKDTIKANGWIPENNKKKNTIVALFMLSAVPLFRLGVAIIIIMMAGITKEQFEEWRKSLNE